jgi:FkbM family methyltransferase
VVDRKTKSIIRYRLRNHVDLAVFDQIFLDLQYDLSRHKQLHELEKTYAEWTKGKTDLRIPLIVDVGSNNGISSSFLGLVWPESTVIGIEPDLGNFELAKRNAPNAVFTWGAVTDEDGLVSISNPESDEWGYMVQKDSNGEIPSFSIRSLLNKYPDKNPFILKIDAEGSEASIFSGDVAWLDLFPLVIIELHDWMLPGQANSANFLRASAGKNRDLVLQGENLLSFRNS